MNFPALQSGPSLESLHPQVVQRLLEELHQLFARRKELEGQLIPRLEEELHRLQSQYHQQRETLQQEYLQRKEQLETEHQHQLQQAQHDFQQALIQAQTTCQQQLQQAQHSFEQAQQEAQEEFEQSKWEIAALLEAQTDHIEGQDVATQSRLAQWDQLFHEAESLGQSYLHRHRITQPELPPVQYPPVSAEQLIPSLQQTAQAVEQLQQEFLKVAKRRGLGALGTLVLAAGFWGLGALALGWVQQFQGWLWIALSGTAGMGLALVAAAVFRAIRTGKILQHYEQMITQARWGKHLLELARVRWEKFQQHQLAHRQSQYEKQLQRLQRQRQARLDKAAQRRDEQIHQAQSQLQRQTQLLEQQHHQRLQELHYQHQQALEELQQWHQQQSQQAHQELLGRIRQLKAQLLEAKDELVGVCSQVEQLLAVQARKVCQQVQEQFPPWEDPGWEQWSGGTESTVAVPLGTAQVRLDQWPEALPEHQELARHWPELLHLPVLFALEGQAGVLYRHTSSGASEAVENMRQVMLRLLTGLPPGKVRFTIIDPVGLGENFAAFMHLADYNEALVGRRIWTQRSHIEKQLADLTEHMEHVIQTYLRNQYETIQQYNAQAGEVAEPYRVLVVAGFPTAFSEAAIRRLMSILSSGPRCGVFVLLSVDAQQKLPPGYRLRDLEQHCLVLRWQQGQYRLQDPLWEPFELQLHAPPDAERMQQLVHRIGHLAQGAGRVEVPFDYLEPRQWWTQDSRHELVAPLGRAGATKLQYFRLGRDTAQHVLVGGKTGSGKSNLLHVLCLSLAMRYSPEELELYLVDFKKGVEFKPYASGQLPHARVVAIESEREFGISVLQRLDEELRRRGDLFRAQGVQDLASYRNATGEKLPRVLLLVDEFQEFFTRDDALAQQASLLLDRLVRQGRAFGIHILLGSQTLAGVFSLARGTLGQMGVRIALQCSETDASLILSEGNTAARLLSRPGEAIYNDAGGLVEGNQPFQVAWLPEHKRQEVLQRLDHLAQEQLGARRPPGPIVFEGAAAARLENNAPLQALLEQSRWEQEPRVYRAWLGEPVAIRPPLAVPFAAESGNHLLLAGYQPEAALAMFTSALISLAAQGPPDQEHEPGVRFTILDGTRPGEKSAGWFETLAAHLPQEVQVAQGPAGQELLAQVAQEVQRRQDQAGTLPRWFVFIYHLAHLRYLRRTEDDFGFGSLGEEKAPSPWNHLQTVLTQGASVGVHVVLWCDAPHVLQQTVDRQLLREFDRRVVFQMGADDSSGLIETPEASSLGLYRALYFDQESGTLEKFRPYQLPEPSWLQQALQHLQRRGW